MLAVATPQTQRVLHATRGLIVGTLAAVTAVGGHLLVMPTHAPSIGALAFLAGVATVLGAFAGGHPPRSWQLVGVLAASQLLGHLALSIGTAHGLAAPSPTMIAAHCAALGVGLLLVDLGDRAVRHALAALHRLAHIASTPLPATAPTWSLIFSDQPLAARRRDGLGRHVRRGPPGLTAHL